jgi:hypothetical protein
MSESDEVVGASVRLGFTHAAASREDLLHSML